MKLKNLWIPTIIFGIIGGAAKICDTLFNRNGESFFLNSMVCSTIFVCSLIMIFLIGVIMAMADTRGNVAHCPVKNIGAALFGFIVSVTLICTGVLSILSVGADTPLLQILMSCIFGIFGGVIMLYESCISFTGHNNMKKIPLLALALPVWSCSRMMQLFLEYSKVSLNSTEMFDLISTVFLTLFLFYQAVYFAGFDQNHGVRRSILYGCCYIMCGMITTADILIKMFYPAQVESNVDTLVVEPTFARILTCATDISFCLYAIFFLAGIAKNVRFEEIDDDDEKPLDDYFGNIKTTDVSDNSEITEDETPSEEFHTSILKFDDNESGEVSENSKEASNEETETVSEEIPLENHDDFKEEVSDENADKDETIAQTVTTETEKAFEEPLQNQPKETVSKTEEVYTAKENTASTEAKKSQYEGYDYSYLTTNTTDSDSSVNMDELYAMLDKMSEG